VLLTPPTLSISATGSGGLNITCSDAYTGNMLS